MKYFLLLLTSTTGYTTLYTAHHIQFFFNSNHDTFNDEKYFTEQEVDLCVLNKNDLFIKNNSYNQSFAQHLYFSLAKLGDFSYANKITPDPFFLVPLERQKNIAKRLVLTGNFHIFNLFLQKKIITKETMSQELVNYADSRKDMTKGNKEIFERLNTKFTENQKKSAPHKRKMYLMSDNEEDPTEINESSECCVCIKKIKKFNQTRHRTLCENNHFAHANCSIELLNYKLTSCPVCRSALTLTFSKKEKSIIRQKQAEITQADAIRQEEELLSEQDALLNALDPEERQFNLNLQSPNDPWDFNDDYRPPTPPISRTDNDYDQEYDNDADAEDNNENDEESIPDLDFGS